MDHSVDPHRAPSDRERQRDESGGGTGVLNTNSPASNSNYTPNPSYPNWIYDVWYEVKVKAQLLALQDLAGHLLLQFMQVQAKQAAILSLLLIPIVPILHLV